MAARWRAGRGFSPAANSGVALLAVLTLVLVVLAMRDPEPSADARSAATAGSASAGKPSPSAPATRPGGPRAGGGGVVGDDVSVLLAAGGEATWRWVGPTECTPGGAAGRLERTADGRTWAAVTLPAAAVSWLDAASSDVATATVLDQVCAASVVTTADGGVTWETLDASGALARVALGRPAGRWGLRHGDVVREVDDVFRPPAAEPCVGTDVSAPSVISALSASAAYVLCQDLDGSGRLLTRTRDGGASWVRLAGKRAESGLAGAGFIASLHTADPRRAVVLMTGAGCPEGELRVTDDGGARWRALPCFEAVIGISNILDVVVRTDGSLYAVARTTAHELVALRSPDGAAWSSEPVAAPG